MPVATKTSCFFFFFLRGLQDCHTTLCQHSFVTCSQSHVLKSLFRLEQSFLNSSISQATLEVLVCATKKQFKKTNQPNPTQPSNQNERRKRRRCTRCGSRSGKAVWPMWCHFLCKQKDVFGVFVGWVDVFFFCFFGGVGWVGV